MTNLSYLISLIIINLILTVKANKISQFLNLYDLPDFKRKIHKQKVSSIGGFYIFFNIIYLLIFDFFNQDQLIIFEYFQYENDNIFFFFICLSTIFSVGVYDDKYGVNASTKLTLFALAILLLTLVDKNLNISSLRFLINQTIYDISNFSNFFTIFCMLVFINAFNMYDGTNLQVTLPSILIMAFFFYVSNFLDYFSLTILISLLFFSILNFQNKLFLGDNGSLILSFIISYIIIKFYNQNIIVYTEEVCLLLLLPIIDLLRLFITRIADGKNPFLPDKNHLHHLLLRRFKYQNTLFILFGLYLIPVIFGIFTKKYLLFIVFQILIYLIIVIFLKKKFKNVQ